uniref:KA1 domain-containing protein n=1 Tax=Amorphochlora amoebiformis TaxID=1561963 RepID=A0A7S0DJ02_9EUKA
MSAVSATAGGTQGRVQGSLKVKVKLHLKLAGEFVFSQSLEDGIRFSKYTLPQVVLDCAQVLASAAHPGSCVPALLPGDQRPDVGALRHIYDAGLDAARPNLLQSPAQALTLLTEYCASLSPPLVTLDVLRLLVSEWNNMAGMQRTSRVTALTSRLKSLFPSCARRLLQCILTAFGFLHTLERRHPSRQRKVVNLLAQKIFFNRHVRRGLAVEIRSISQQNPIADAEELVGKLEDSFGVAASAIVRSCVYDIDRIRRGKNESAVRICGCLPEDRKISEKDRVETRADEDEDVGIHQDVLGMITELLNGIDSIYGYNSPAVRTTRGGQGERTDRAAAATDEMNRMRALKLVKEAKLRQMNQVDLQAHFSALSEKSKEAAAALVEAQRKRVALAHHICLWNHSDRLNAMNRRVLALRKIAAAEIARTKDAVNRNLSCEIFLHVLCARGRFISNSDVWEANIKYNRENRSSRSVAAADGIIVFTTRRRLKVTSHYNNNVSLRFKCGREVAGKAEVPIRGLVDSISPLGCTVQLANTLIASPSSRKASDSRALTFTVFLLVDSLPPAGVASTAGGGILRHDSSKPRLLDRPTFLPSYAPHNSLKDLHKVSAQRNITIPPESNTSISTSGKSIGSTETKVEETKGGLSNKIDRKQNVATPKTHGIDPKTDTREMQRERNLSMEGVIQEVEKAREALDRIILEMEVTSALMYNHDKKLDIEMDRSDDNISLLLSARRRRLDGRKNLIGHSRRVSASSLASSTTTARLRQVTVPDGKAKNAPIPEASLRPGTHIGRRRSTEILRKEIKLLRKQLEDVNREHALKRDSTSAEKKKAEIPRDKIDLSEMDIGTYQARVEVRIRELDAETRNLKQRADYEFEKSKIRSLRDQIDLLKEQKKHYEELNRRYELAVKTANQENSAMSSKQESLEAQLATQTDQITDITQRLTDSQAREATLKFEVVTVRARLQAAEAERLRLEREVGRRYEFREFESRMRRVAQMDVLEMLRRADGLKSEIVSLNLHKSRWDALETANKRLIGELSRATQRESSWRKRAIELAKRVERLKGENSHALAMLRNEQAQGLAALMVSLKLNFEDV